MADQFKLNPFTGNFDLVSDLSGYVPYTGATANVNLNTKNLLGGTFTNTITGSQNINFGKDDYYAINLSNFFFQYRTFGGARWYDPINPSSPSVINIGDVFVMISNNAILRTLTVATVSGPTGSPSGYALTFNETYTPAVNDQMQKLSLVTHNLNSIVYNKSIVMGDYNSLTSFSLSSLVMGTSNTDTMASALPLAIIGNSNSTKGGIVFGDSNVNTRSSSSAKIYLLGSSNTDSSTDSTTHFVMGDTNAISGSTGFVNVLGNTNTITNAAYVVGTTNTMSGGESFALGRLNTVSSTFGTAIGNLNKSRAYAEVVLGHNGEDVTALSATSYNALDWALRLGAGTGNISPTNSKDVFRVMKNGGIYNYLQTATAVGHTIKQFASATADAFQLQNPSGTVLTSINASGGLTMSNAGAGIAIKEGTNATMGQSTLVAGTVVVSTTKVTASSRIFLQNDGGTLTNIGNAYVSARTAGTSFTITSTNILDTSNVDWVIFEPS